jgi:hypothetical protein
MGKKIYFIITCGTPQRITADDQSEDHLLFLFYDAGIKRKYPKKLSAVDFPGFRRICSRIIWECRLVF